MESYRESALAVVDRSLEDTTARSRALRRARACGRGRQLDRDDSEEVEVVAVAVPTGSPEDRDGFPRRLVGEPLYYISGVSSDIRHTTYGSPLEARSSSSL